MLCKSLSGNTNNKNDDFDGFDGLAPGGISGGRLKFIVVLSICSREMAKNLVFLVCEGYIKIFKIWV